MNIVRNAECVSLEIVVFNFKKEIAFKLENPAPILTYVN